MPIGYFHRMYGYDSGAKCEFTKLVFEEKKEVIIFIIIIIIIIVIII